MRLALDVRDPPLPVGGYHPLHPRPVAVRGTHQPSLVEPSLVGETGHRIVIRPRVQGVDHEGGEGDGGIRPREPPQSGGGLQKVVLLERTTLGAQEGTSR